MTFTLRTVGGGKHEIILDVEACGGGGGGGGGG